jgi:hypothetical protein
MLLSKKYKKKYQTPEVTDLGKVSEMTQENVAFSINVGKNATFFSI